MDQRVLPPPFRAVPVEDLAPSRFAWLTPRTQIVLAACACSGTAAFLYAVDPTRHHVYPVCVFYQTTGIYCAGCGATRALHALLHGHVLEALHDNLLLVALLPVVAYFVISRLPPVWRNNAWPQLTLKPKRIAWIVGLLVVLMIGFMTLRNLSGWPFGWLRPLAS